MRSTHEDDWSIPRNIESTSGSNLPEEYTCDHMPEQQRRLVGQLRARLDRFHLAFEAERRLDDWRAPVTPMYEALLGPCYRGYLGPKWVVCGLNP